MKAQKIISTAEEFLKSSDNKTIHKSKFLKKILKSLRIRERKLEKRLELKSVNEEKIKRELAIVHAYRKKGLKVLKKMKKDKK